MAAASPVSADSNVGEEGHGVYVFTPDDKENPEEAMSNKEQVSKVTSYARNLPILYQKILKLKGVNI